MDVRALKSTIDLLAVIGSRVALTRRGKEYYGLCPFHSEDTPSFTVAPDKGFWHCFGCDMNGDAIDFVRETEGLSFLEAVKVITDGNFSTAPIGREHVIKRKSTPDWISSTPPEDAPMPEFALGNGQLPSHVWTYRGSDGGVIGYIARYAIEHDGKVGKIFQPVTWGKYSGTNDEPSWQTKVWAKPRPLYGLDVIAKNTTGQVIIVEGEKACDSARLLFPNSPCVTWPGGANAIPHINFAPLYGRSVLTIADNDEPGKAAMRRICALLSANGCKVMYIEPESSRESGWDLADALEENWDAANALKWAKSLVKRYVPDAPLESPPPALPLIPAPGPPRVPTLRLVSGNERNNGGDNDTPDGTGGDQQEDMPPAFSDDALAMQFASDEGADWRYVASGMNVSWVHWTGQRWQKDLTGLIRQNIRLSLRRIANFRMSEVLTEAQRKSICSSKTRNSVYEMVKTDQSLATIRADWNKDDWSLATPGGIVDLRTGQLASWRKEDLVDRYTSVSPGGSCERWIQFMREVTGNNDDMCNYLQRLCGYFLTGVTSEHVMAFFYGTGANGKSVFINTISTILSDYASNSPMETFSEQRNDRHSTELARLDGARLVTSQETEVGRRWAESRIKSLTGGDRITARFMHQDDFEFAPKFKLLFAGNSKPGLKSTDEAIRRRIHIVPFSVTIPQGERDTLLQEKLHAEAAGILQWMIDGCLLWQKHGLNPPSEVIDATNDYVESEDDILAWINSSCDIGPNLVSPIKDLYANYRTYCDDANERPIKRRRLMQYLTGHGYEETVDFGVTWIRGISPKV